MKFLYRIIQFFLGILGISIVILFLFGVRLLWGPMDITSFLSIMSKFVDFPQDVLFEKASIKYKGAEEPLLIKLEQVSFENIEGTQGKLAKVEGTLNYKALLTGRVIFDHIYLQNPDILFHQTPQAREGKDIIFQSVGTLGTGAFLEILLEKFSDITLEKGIFSYRSEKGEEISLPEYNLFIYRGADNSSIEVRVKAPFVIGKKIEDGKETSYTASSFEMEGKYDLTKRSLLIEKSSFFWMDEMKVTFQAKIDLSGKEGIYFDISGKTSVVPLSMFPLIWPVFLAPSPRNWIIENLSVGEVKEATLHTQGFFSYEKKQLGLNILEGFLDLNNITVQYLTGLPSVEQVDGKATYTDKTFAILIEKGILSDVVVKSGSLLFSALDTDQEMAHIDLNLQGSLGTFLNVLDHPPLAYPEKIGINPNDFFGKVDLNLVLDFPLLKSLSLEELQVKAQATLKNLEYKQEFSGENLIFSEGYGDLVVTKENMELTTQGKLEGVPTAIEWREIFSDSKSIFSLKGTYPLNILEKFNIKIDQEAKGVFDLDIMCIKNKEGAYVGDVKIDLTQASFAIPFLGWDKKVGYKAQGNASFLKGINKNKLTFKKVNIEAPQIDIKGSFSLDLEKNYISQADFPSFITPFSKGALKFSTVSSGKEGLVYKINIQGTYADLSAFWKEEEKDSSAGKINFYLKMGVDKLFFRENYPIKKALLTLERNKGRTNKFLLHGVLEEEALLEILFGSRQEQKGEVLRVHTSDAGAFFRAIDFYDDLEGGTLQIEGVRSQDKQDAFLNGTMRLEEFRLKETPVIAKILSLASLQGLVDVFQGKGVYFRSAKLNFQANDSIIEIEKGLAESTATGVSLKGIINRKDKVLDLKGTIIPVYMLNSILSHIPLLGDVLAGGKDKGLFATSFSVTGPYVSSEVTVNPLSTITPGFLKNIFDF